MTVIDKNIEQLRHTECGAELSRSIGLSHLSWRFEPTSTAKVSGRVASRAIGPLRVSWLDVSLGNGDWHGHRGEREIETVPEPYLTVVMPLSGQISLSGANTQITVSERELAIWDSTQNLAFDIADQCYEQISVLVPQRMLRANRESSVALHCAHVDKDNVLSELCVQHMSTLAKFINARLRPYELSLGSVTTSLVDSMIASLIKSPRDRDHLISDIKNYVECYLTDENLSPKSIASAFEISTRYVHKLFEQQGHTIREWILERRLERSLDDLISAETSITDAAFRWGFKDLGHYSRSFKKRFKQSPSAYRKKAQQAYEDGGVPRKINRP